MTHLEASELLPLYALDALDPAELPELEVHVSDCPTCARELRSFESAAASLGAAVPVLQPPNRLRQRLLASAAAVPLPSKGESRPVPLPSRGERLGEGTPLPPRRRGILPFPTRAPSWLAAAVLVLVLAGGAAAGFARDASDSARLRTDDAALALLTSTETSVDRLEPAAAGVPAEAHGHWYHRDGVPTQVIVGEFLPPAGSGRQYVAWERQGTAWLRAGALDGNKRVVVLGSDGRQVTAVEITRDSSAAAQPGSDVVLRFAKPQ